MAFGSRASLRQSQAWLDNKHHETSRLPADAKDDLLYCRQCVESGEVQHRPSTDLLPDEDVHIT